MIPRLFVLWLAAAGHLTLLPGAATQLAALYHQSVTSRVEAMACLYGTQDTAGGVTVERVGPAVVRLADARAVLGWCPAGVVAVVHVHLPVAIVDVPGYQPCAAGPDDRPVLERQQPARNVDVILCGED